MEKYSNRYGEILKKDLYGDYVLERVKKGSKFNTFEEYLKEKKPSRIRKVRLHKSTIELLTKKQNQ